MEIAISFDDGPDPAYTEDILEVLKEHQVKAAFFCIGRRIAGNEKILKSILQQEHVIGNHSYSHHGLFDLFPYRKMSADIHRMDEELRRVTGLTPRMFRPPYGVTNPALAKAIRRGKYVPVGWNIRSLDTVITDEEKLLSRVTRSLAPGSIILFHDTNKTTLSILPAFIKACRSQGYQFVRLDKMLKLEPYV